MVMHQVFVDERGKLTAIDRLNKIGFKIARVYFLHGCTPHLMRGGHAHKELKQLLFIVNGSALIKIDDGSLAKEILINEENPTLSLVTPTWREIQMQSKDSVLGVLASAEYDPTDYISTYKDFCKFVGQCVD